jgi:hypothetical protein
MNENATADLPADEEENGRCVAIPIPSSDKVYIALLCSPGMPEGIWVDLDFVAHGDNLMIKICNESSYLPMFYAVLPRQELVACVQNRAPILAPLVATLLEFVDETPYPGGLNKTLFHVVGPETFQRLWDGDGDFEIPTRRVTGVPDPTD